MLDFYFLKVSPVMTLNAYPTHIYRIYSLAAFQITRSGKLYCMLTGQWVGVIMICIRASKRHSQLKLYRCISISVNFVCSLQRLYNEIKVITLSVYCISRFLKRYHTFINLQKSPISLFPTIISVSMVISSEE